MPLGVCRTNEHRATHGAGVSPPMKERARRRTGREAREHGKAKAAAERRREPTRGGGGHDRQGKDDGNEALTAKQSGVLSG